jgi:hypothetical protein
MTKLPGACGSQVRWRFRRHAQLHSCTYSHKNHGESLFISCSKSF